MDKNQQKLIYINEGDLQDIIAYLKDYSELIGKTYHKANDFKVQQQIGNAVPVLLANKIALQVKEVLDNEQVSKD